MNKSELRAIFPHLEKDHTYLNHAAISPQSDRVKEALERFISDRNSGNIDNFEEWMKITEETRGLIAQLINTGGTDRISFMGNTSDAISVVAEGFDWNPGDEIILNTMEFPANIQPFRILERKGVKLIYLEPDDEGKVTRDMIEDAITSKTKFVSISAVQYLNGFRADLKSIGEVCQKNDIYFIVDGIQALGAIEIDVEACQIDALATGGHKWLMGPMGIGFLYLSEKLANDLTPAKTGWLSVETPWELSNFNQEWLPISQHLETGTFNMMGIVGFNASLSNLLGIGKEAVEKEIMELTAHLFANVLPINGVQIITPKSPEHHAGIFTFSLPENSNAEEVVHRLQTEKMTISAREGFVRISPHYYNTTNELDRVLDSIF
ncbi:aminotransferase class V-fold PLP-dependent enzyme [Rhodohalobacter sp. 614A]|uniref:aminotransferase class V-fold PLP-dependent enzyme n=1 Tax=Rhodohalobacter sp. 614A TaxID=2908649 RepID=UPI001F2F6D1E|nr:aminotransferase class V-fold PLP-dependent enzyme [Rhodohalobacter sp. 614A]